MDDNDGKEDTAETDCVSGGAPLFIFSPTVAELLFLGTTEKLGEETKKDVVRHVSTLDTGDDEVAIGPTTLGALVVLSLFAALWLTIGLVSRGG